MTFNTAICLLLILTGIGYVIAHQISHRWPENLVLLTASLFFYGFWDYRFLFLLFVSSGIDYIPWALGIARPSIPRRIFGVFALLSVCTVLLCTSVDWYGIRTLVFPSAAYAGLGRTPTLPRLLSSGRRLADLLGSHGDARRHFSEASEDSDFKETRSGASAIFASA
ncbi:MAG: hypothetical protein U1D30_20990 [Planctomycetota bacterium]